MLFFFLICRVLCVFFQNGISEMHFSENDCLGGYDFINYYMDDYCFYDIGYSYRFETSGTTVTKYRCYGYGCGDCLIMVSTNFGDCVNVGLGSYKFNIGEPTLNKYGFYEKFYNVYVDDCTAGFMYYRFYINGNDYLKCYDEGCIRDEERTVIKKSGECHQDLYGNYYIPYCDGSETYVCSGIDSFQPDVCSFHGNCTKDGCVCNDGYFGDDCQYSCIYYDSCTCYKTNFDRSYICTDTSECFGVDKCEISQYYTISTAGIHGIKTILFVLIFICLF